MPEHLTRQRGFTLYIVLGALLVISLLGIALKAQTARLELSEAKYERFTGEVERNGLAAAERAKRINTENQAKKEKIDRENKRLRSNVARLSGELRRNHPAGGGVPEAPAGSKRPDLACFDRPAFSGAYGKLVTELREIADQCTADAVDLNSAKEWAKQ